jgi:hypothetical protein
MICQIAFNIWQREHGFNGLCTDNKNACMFHSITVIYPQKFNSTAKSLNKDYYEGEKSEELH